MRRWSALLVLWLGVGPLSPAAGAGAAEAVLAQANSALASGQYAAAVMLITGGLADAGLDDLVRSRLLVARGLSQQALGQADEALVDFTRALQGASLQGAERARALFARGLSLDGAGRLREAIGDYSAALTFAPGATYALNNRANVYRRQGQFELARRDYAAALEAKTPNPQYPYFGLGQIAEAQGDRQAAREFYSKAIAADSGYQLALDRLQAMGPPTEGLAGLPADTGIIVLHPPATRKEASVVLRPPSERQEKAVPASPRRPAVLSVTAPSSPPGWGAPLRPAIVEAASTGRALVQLGAWRSEAEARAGWKVAQDRAGELLAQTQPLIVRAEVPGRGVYYRLRIAANEPVPQFCAALAEKGLACIPARD